MSKLVRDALVEVLGLCALGDVDETTEAYGWGGVIKQARAALASEPVMAREGLAFRMLEALVCGLGARDGRIAGQQAVYVDLAFSLADTFIAKAGQS